jgi:hypothetical protein
MEISFSEERDERSGKHWPPASNQEEPLKRGCAPNRLVWESLIEQ